MIAADSESPATKTILNPLCSVVIPPNVLEDHAEERTRVPYAFISTKKHPSLPLSIHNYNQRALTSSPFSSYTWHANLDKIADSAVLSDTHELSLAVTLASRSLVTEWLTGRIISRSFPKFFNYHEKLAYQPTGQEYSYEIQEKIDGSIINLSWYDRPSSGSTSKEGQWIVTSRSSFSSPHTESAWKLLNTRFPSLFANGPNPLLDKTKTYVFELVDNRMPIKIHYSYGCDLILLSIIGSDGSEPKRDGDAFAKLPFRRPRVWKLEELLRSTNGRLDPQQLSKLDRENEEGFVISFWRTRDDVHPQRIKVKLDSYLKLYGPKQDSTVGKFDSLSSMSQRPSTKSDRSRIKINRPPSPAVLLAVYTTYRLSLPSFIGIESRMSSLKEFTVDAIRDLNVMDDYGGDAWIAKISKICDRINALFSIQEVHWKDTVRKLEAEGYRPLPQSNRKSKQDFERRINSADVDRSSRGPLRAWFEGKDVKELVKVVVESLEFPKDLMSTEVIVLGK